MTFFVKTINSTVMNTQDHKSCNYPAANSRPVVGLVLSVLLAVSFWSCRHEETYLANVPEYMSFEEFRASFKSSAAQEIVHAGKIYLKDNYLFINEVNKGIHVIDNSNPSKPLKLCFYEIPGNVDIAIRGNILFADSYVDLVSVDISQITAPVEVGRLENAFPQVMAFPEDMSIPFARVDYSKGVVVGWKVQEVSYPVDHSWGWGWWGRISFDGSVAAGESAGVAGSMARFMLHQQYLYAVVNPWELKTLDVSDASAIAPIDSIYPGREMETLFRLDKHLFIGTTSGMLVYDLENPAKPEFLSAFDHANACDPVVVENNIAYVTLRSGTSCQNFTNQLDVIDISDISRPKLLKSYPLFNPHGLGIDNGILFICDGAAGLKIYNAQNPLAIQSNMIAHFGDIDTYDVIPLNGVLMLIGHDGLFQYDYSNLLDIRLLSHIRISSGK